MEGRSQENCRDEVKLKAAQNWVRTIENLPNSPTFIIRKSCGNLRDSGNKG